MNALKVAKGISRPQTLVGCSTVFGVSNTNARFISSLGRRFLIAAVSGSKTSKPCTTAIRLLDASLGFNTVPSRNAWFTKSRMGPRIAPTLPLSYDNSGDLEQKLPAVDLSLPRLGYEKCEELKTADTTIKQIFSLKFGTGQDRKKFISEQLLSRTQRHRGDYTSIEAHITRLTVKIRTQIPNCLQFRKDKVTKCRLNDNIQRRRKLLKRLRVSDLPKFEKLCEELKIVYVPLPEEIPRNNPVLKQIKAAEDESVAIRLSKVKALEKDLAVQREQFYKEKEKELAQIAQDLAAMNIDGQKMMQDIETAEKKLDRWHNTKLYRFLQRFPAVNKKYVTMRVQQ